MKKSINTIMLGLMAGLVVCVSCNKKLSEYNPSGATPEGTYVNAKGMNALVNGAYGYARFWYGKEEGYSVSEMGTDIWISGAGDVFTPLTRYENLQGSNVSALNLLWDNFYAAIFLCNTGISKVAGIPDYTDKEKLTREAELRFLRAFYYWHIVETWGGVHFTTQPAVGSESTAFKKPVDSFYNQIFTDLQFAVKNLPATSSDYGRATIPVAKAFLARMYLTRGMNEQAIALANDVIKNHGFSLVPNYNDLWNMGNLKNKEVIWAIDYSNNLANNDATSTAYPSGHSRGSNNGHLFFLPVYDQVATAVLIRDINNGRPFNRYMPTLSFLNMFNENDDARYQGSFQTVWYCNKAGKGAGNSFNKKDTFNFKLGDTILYCPKFTVDAAVSNAKHYTTYDFSRVYKANGASVQNNYYPALKKFKDSTRTVAGEVQSARDVFVMRLAEMYLIAAEGELKIGKLDSAAYYLNVIRTRAAIPGHESAMQITGSDVTIDFILDERARELCGEQLRWFDLKRTGKLLDRVKALNPEGTKFIQPFHTVRPIPQTQLDAVSNKGEFMQNEGYQ